MSLIEIHPISTQNLESFLDLADEMDEFYGEDPSKLQAARATRREETKDALIYDPPKAFAFAAQIGERVIGFASCSFLWPARGTTTSLYLKELYVAKEERRRGTGRLLVAKVCDFALSNECSRLELATEATNLEAQNFYDKLGLPINNTQRVSYRLQPDDMRRLSNS